MITINLLPDEYKRSRRTPLKAVAMTAVSATINAGLLAIVAWTHFGVRTEVSSELEMVESDLASLEPRMDYHAKLEKEKKLFVSRETTLDDITKNRINWTSKVDQLVDTINRGGDGEKYMIWLDDLNVVQSEVKAKKGQADPSAGSFRGKGHSGSPNFGLVANFFEDLSNSEFAEGFFPPAPPEGRRSSVDEELIPSEIFSFSLDLNIKAPAPKPAAKKADVKKPDVQKK